MVRRISALVAATAAAGSFFVGAAPANALEVCDPNAFVCVLVLDDRQDCDGGYDTIVRVPNVATGGVVAAVCFLQ